MLSLMRTAVNFRSAKIKVTMKWQLLGQEAIWKCEQHFTLQKPIKTSPSTSNMFLFLYYEPKGKDTGSNLAPGCPGSSEWTATTISLRLVFHLCPFLKKKELAIVTHGLDTSRLYCCNILYAWLLAKRLQTLNAAKCCSIYIGHVENSALKLQELLQLSVTFCTQFKVFTIIYKTP